jgi:hypothetical protein
LLYSRKTDKDPRIAIGFVDFVGQVTDAFSVGVGADYYDYAAGTLVNEEQGELYDGVELAPSVETVSEYDDGRSDWYPRLGLAYSPLQWFQIRAAYFEYVSRPSVVGQSIQSTNFFGFNKVYDDIFDGVQSKNYALGVDFRQDEINYGASFVKRDLRVPEEEQMAISFLDQEEQIAEYYLGLLVMKGMAFSTGGIWSQRKANEFSALPTTSINDFEQYQFPFRLAMYGGKSFAFFVDQSYFVQDFKSADEASQDRSSTWVTDVAVRYRFGRRYGDLTVGVKNLFDESEEFLSSSVRELAFYPNRFWYASVSINY